MLQNYLNKRGISDEVIKSMSIFYKPFFSKDLDDIWIPLYEGAYKIRRNPLSADKPKYIHTAGARVVLFGLDKIKDDDKEVVICEGEFDCMLLMSLNIPAVTSTGGALSFKIEWLENLLSVKERKITIALDNDTAGIDGAIKILNYAEQLNALHRIKVCLVPTANAKDISDYYSIGGDIHSLIEVSKTYNNEQDIIADMIERSVNHLSIDFHKRCLEKIKTNTLQHKPKINNNSIDIKLIKTIPMTDYVNFKNGKALCPFHNESTPSFHYYKQTNTAYCFGCGKIADVIDIVRVIKHCSFKEAIQALIK